MLKIYLIENVRGMQPGLEPATSDSAVDKTSEITFKKINMYFFRYCKRKPENKRPY